MCSLSFNFRSCLTETPNPYCARIICQYKQITKIHVNPKLTQRYSKGYENPLRLLKIDTSSQQKTVHLSTAFT